MVEFYEQEGILVASEGLSLYLHEARDSFYDPIRNERVATLIARDVQIRNHENENRYCSWNLPRLAALILNCDSHVFDFQEREIRGRMIFLRFSTALLECLNLI